MPQETTYYQLKKPLETETYNVDVFNDNFDAIDNQMHVNAEAIKKKQDTITGSATTITSATLTKDRVVITDGSGKIAVSSITTTKLGYLTDVTSNIQAQFTAMGTRVTTAQSTADGKVSRSGDTMTGRLWNSYAYPIFFTSNGISAIKKSEPSFLRSSLLPTNDATLQFSVVPTDNEWFIANQFGFGTQKCELNADGTYKSGGDGTMYLSVRSAEDKANAVMTLKALHTGEKYATCPTPSSTTDDSTKIATTHWVANAGCVIHSTNNETKSGNLTFKNNIYFQSTQDVSATRSGDTWINNQYRFKAMKGTSEVTLARYQPMLKADGSNELHIAVSNNDGVEKVLVLSSNGYVTIPTTPSGAASNEIATADWSLGKFVKKSGDTMTGSLQIRMTEPRIYSIEPNGDKSTAPSSTMTAFYLQCRDKNSSPYGNILSLRHDTSDNFIFDFGVDGRTWGTGIQVVSAKNGTAYATAPPSSPSIRSLRNITVSTSTPSGGHDGDLWIVIKG